MSKRSLRYWFPVCEAFDRGFTWGFAGRLLLRCVVLELLDGELDGEEESEPEKASRSCEVRCPVAAVFSPLVRGVDAP